MHPYQLVITGLVGNERTRAERRNSSLPYQLVITGLVGNANLRALAFSALLRAPTSWLLLD